jgi:hypothetical protein
VENDRPQYKLLATNVIASSIIWTPSPLCPLIPTKENFGGFSKWYFNFVGSFKNCSS